MKKLLSLLAIAALAICLVGSAFARPAPMGAVQATREGKVVWNSDGSAEMETIEMETIPLTLEGQVMVWVAAALALALFGLLTVSPLLLEDPALRREAGIYPGAAGLPGECDSV